MSLLYSPGREFVSIVIPSYNKGRYIKSSLDSVCNQSYDGFELIVVDDYSSDDSREILEEYGRGNPHIRLFFNERNKGTNYCRNLGWQRARGEWIIFLDADDLLAASCLEERIKVIREMPDLHFAVFTMGVFRHEIGDLRRRWVPDSKSPLEDFLSHRLPWGICQPIWRKSFLSDIGGFDESFLRRQDVDLHTRALLRPGVEFTQVSGEPDCFYRSDEGRINYDMNEFARRSVLSSLRYCDKFFQIAKERGIAGRLTGTIYETYSWLLYRYRINSLDKDAFLAFEAQILSALDSFSISRFKRFLFWVGKFFNLFPIRVRGINRLIFRLVIR